MKTHRCYRCGDAVTTISTIDGYQYRCQCGAIEKVENNYSTRTLAEPSPPSQGSPPGCKFWEQVFLVSLENHGEVGYAVKQADEATKAWEGRFHD